MAEGEVNKLVFECKDLKEAYVVYDNAVEHKDMIEVEILRDKPEYNDNAIYTSFKTIKEYPDWYEWKFGEK